MLRHYQKLTSPIAWLRKATLLLWIWFIFPTFGSTQSLVSHKAEGDAGIGKALKEFEENTTCHTGLSIYDVQKGTWLFRYQEDNFFIPASNVKILTMYAALQELKTYLDAAYTLVKGDTLFVWGAGDPGTLYPDRDSTNTFVGILRQTEKVIVFSNQHFQTTRFGKGWAWDDHQNSYQVERNAYPVYGNRLWIDRYGDSIVVTPNYYAPFLVAIRDTTLKLDRSELGDQYFYHYRPVKPLEQKSIPLRFFRNDLSIIWQEVTGKSVLFGDLPLDPKAKPIAGSARDSLLKSMMQDSDNFIAEQLLLASSFKKLKVMDEEAMIDTLLHGKMRFVLDSIQWMDGSGLSRYNLMTPNSVIRILSHLYDEKGLPYLKQIFATAGVNGSISNWLLSYRKKPFLFAKSGTMRNVLNLSGYLVTRKGKIYIFSWMNNQCIDKTSRLKDGMEKLLTLLYEEY